MMTNSQIHTQADVALMRDHQVNAFLAGKAFMRQDDPVKALTTLMRNYFLLLLKATRLLCIFLGFSFSNVEAIPVTDNVEALRQTLKQLAGLKESVIFSSFPTYAPTLPKEDKNKLSYLNWLFAHQSSQELEYAYQNLNASLKKDAESLINVFNLISQTRKKIDQLKREIDCGEAEEKNREQLSSYQRDYNKQFLSMTGTKSSFEGKIGRGYKEDWIQAKHLFLTTRAYPALSDFFKVSIPLINATSKKAVSEKQPMKSYLNKAQKSLRSDSFRQAMGHSVLNDEMTK